MQQQRTVLVDQPGTLLLDVIEAAGHDARLLPWCTGAEVLARDGRLVGAALQRHWRGLAFKVRTRNPRCRLTALTILPEDVPLRHTRVHGC